MIKELNEVVSCPVHNRIIGNPKYLSGSYVEFRGKGNILYVQKNVRLSDCRIKFCGDNALIYLSSNNYYLYKLNIDAWSGTTVYFGRNNYFNGMMNCIISERQNLIVGDNGVFSFGIWMRTADPHIIYDINTKKRINISKSIVIGDHVWLGQNTLILKGASIGSGSVLSANGVVAGKKIESNTIYGGNPARLIKKDVFFFNDSVHNYSEEMTTQSMSTDSDEYIYSSDEGKINTGKVLKALSQFPTAEEKLRYLKKKIVSCEHHNRFAVIKNKNDLLHRIKKKLK